MKLQEIQSCLQSADEEVRRSAIQALKGMPLTESLTLVFKAMGDESWRVRKESVELFVNSTPDELVLVKLLELIRNEDNAGLRNSAAEAVIRLGSTTALPLIRMLKDHDPDVRKFVVDMMGAIGDPLFVQPLLNALFDTNINVASAAAEHLGSSGDSLVIPELVQAIATNQAVLFRFSALGALSALAKPSAVPVEILRLADEDILRKAVYDCLGSISDESSFSLLINGFYSNEKGSRSAAVKAIFRIYGRSSITVRQKMIAELRRLKGNDAISGLLNLFDSRDSLLTEALIWCSAATEDVRFVNILIELFADERFAEPALNALKNFGQEGILNAVALYHAADENARKAICTLIGDSGCSGYSDLLGNALNDNSACVRTAAAAAVGKLGIISSIPDLVAMVDDTDPNVSSSAVSSLQMLSLIDRSAILDIATQLSASEVPRHRRYASLLFGSLGMHESLLMLVKDQEPAVRQAAVKATGNLGLKFSDTILFMALVDEDPDVRIAAADALGSLKENASLDTLEHALEDEDAWVRCAALRAIAKIDRTRLITIIKRLYAVEKGLFLITCIQLLETVGGSDALSMIESSLIDPDPDIARQASMSLMRCLSNK